MSSYITLYIGIGRIPFLADICLICGAAQQISPHDKPATYNQVKSSRIHSSENVQMEKMSYPFLINPSGRNAYICYVGISAKKIP